MSLDGGDFEHTRQSTEHGWSDILKRTRNELSHDHCTILAGGVAFFILIGIVPGLAALIGICALVLDPAQIQHQFASIKDVLPQGAYDLLTRQMQRIVSSPKMAGWGAGLGILVALWGGSKAVKALIEGLNVAYDVEEKRGFIRLNLVAIVLTLAGVIGAAIMIGLITVLPRIAGSMGAAGIAHVWVNLARWPLLLVCFVFALMLLYRYGPSRDKVSWKQVSWGAVGAAILWLAASALFSFYAANFGHYNKTYGALGAVVILMMWFYISAYCVLLGAELNSEIEPRDERESTASPSETA